LSSVLSGSVESLLKILSLLPPPCPCSHALSKKKKKRKKELGFALIWWTQVEVSKTKSLYENLANSNYFNYLCDNKYIGFRNKYCQCYIIFCGNSTVDILILKHQKLWVIVLMGEKTCWRLDRVISKLFLIMCSINKRFLSAYIPINTKRTEIVYVYIV